MKHSILAIIAINAVCGQMGPLSDLLDGVGGMLGMNSGPELETEAQTAAEPQPETDGDSPSNLEKFPTLKDDTASMDTSMSTPSTESPSMETPSVEIPSKETPPMDAPSAGDSSKREQESVPLEESQQLQEDADDVDIMDESEEKQEDSAPVEDFPKLRDDTMTKEAKFRGGKNGRRPPNSRGKVARRPSSESESSNSESSGEESESESSEEEEPRRPMRGMKSRRPAYNSPYMKGMYGSKPVRRAGMSDESDTESSGSESFENSDEEEPMRGMKGRRPVSKSARMRSMDGSRPSRDNSESSTDGSASESSGEEQPKRVMREKKGSRWGSYGYGQPKSASRMYRRSNEADGKWNSRNWGESRSDRECCPCKKMYNVRGDSDKMYGGKLYRRSKVTLSRRAYKALLRRGDGYGSSRGAYNYDY